MTLPRVTDPKEIPLGVPIRVDVILEHQIVFIIRELHCDQQITRLEPRLEQKSRIRLRLRNIVLARGSSCVLNLAFCLQPSEVFIFALDIMLLHKFLYVDQIGRNLAHRLAEGGILGL